MNISGSFGKVDKVGFAQPRQASIDSVEQIVSRDIIRRLYPLPFKHSPKSLGNVEMRGIRRQEEKEKTLFSHIFLISFIYLLLCTLALSSTMNVSFLIVRENLSRKSAMRSDVMLSVEQKP